MTDQSSPITPPPELVQQWLCSHDYLWGPLEQASITITANRLQNIATVAAQWGWDQRGTINEAQLQERADQELEACCEWTTVWISAPEASQLFAARRPKPPTLNSIALQMLGTIEQSEHFIPEITDTIRRALEALPND